MAPKIQPVRPTLRDVDLGYHVGHYIDLFWRRKWFIFVAGGLALLGWMFYVLEFSNIRPELESTVLIGLENTADLSAVRDVGEIGRGNVELLRSRNFLSSVVEQLSLRLVVSRYARNEIFDSIDVRAAARRGRYNFVVSKKEPKTFSLSFRGVDADQDEMVAAGREISRLDTVMANGVWLLFSREFRKQPHNVTFSVIRDRDAVERIRKNIDIDFTGARDGYVAVTLKGTDYPLITKTVNSIADEFVAKNLWFRKRKTRELLDILGRQLESSTTQLAGAEAALQKYREENPTVGFSEGARQKVQDLVTLESANFQHQMAVQDAARLRRQYNQSEGEDRNRTISEMLAFLAANAVANSAALQADYTQLVSQRIATAASYAKDHPVLLNIDARIGSLNLRVLSILDDFIHKQNTRLGNNGVDMDRLAVSLRNLPAKELRFAELLRRQQICTEIQNIIQSRFNQAKISDAVEVTDVYIMDYAVAPEAPPDFVNALIRIALGVMIGLFVGFGPVVIADLFDKTARTASEVVRLIDLPVLETIPVIRPKNRKQVPKGEGAGKAGVDEKLIATDYSGDVVGELFRSLRTKVLLHMGQAKRRSLVVTSLYMEEGKSLAAGNLAVAMAQQKLRTLLVDGDLRRGVLHDMFALDRKPGLTSLLHGDEQLDTQMLSRVIQTTHIPNLHLISSGASVPNPSELLCSSRLGEIVEMLHTMFEMIIVDTAPLGITADAAGLKGAFDCYVLIAKAGSSNLFDLRHRIAEFPDLRNKILGIILNQAPIDRRLKYYTYSHYHY